ncbi:unnamed protein product [Chironomus riparius]|uniref:Chromo domain-containing protein n=1 Tax=Chironomus riparius TaxID=315576 RepID=A0A9N9RIC0_9DIPT|nr:unnamed protein product [Chironomus riparius]
MDGTQQKFYLVENILGTKIKHGKKYFLIKWMGYSARDNSWEPEENINPELVRYYDNLSDSSDDCDYKNYRPNTKKFKARKTKRKSTAKGKTVEVKQESVEVAENPLNTNSSNATKVPAEINDSSSDDYDDPADAYKNDPLNGYYETTNYEEPKSDCLDDIQPSTSRDYQEASLSQATTERAPQIPHSHFQAIKSSPKRRVKFVQGYSQMQFEDEKLRMLVQYEGQQGLKFVLHEELRYESPQKLIDFYEKLTNWSDRDKFNP